MGRTLKRVPMDFDWPIGKIWEGYLNPHWSVRKDCTGCDGTGYSEAGRRFKDQWYGYSDFDPIAYGAEPLTVDHPGVVQAATRNCQQSPHFYGSIEQEARRLFQHWKGQWSHHLIQADVDALVAGHRLWDFTRVPLTDEHREIVRQKIADGGNSWLPFDNGRIPTAQEVNHWSLLGMGHDSCNQHVCLEARCLREGVEYKCRVCDGDGAWWPSDEAEALYENWIKEEPPVGDGFQLWETTSEGSPSSPVFETLDQLCEWCAESATTFGSFKATADEWRKMLASDSVCHQEGNMVFL